MIDDYRKWRGNQRGNEYQPFSCILEIEKI